MWPRRKKVGRKDGAIEQGLPCARSSGLDVCLSTRQPWKSQLAPQNTKCQLPD